MQKSGRKRFLMESSKDKEKPITRVSYGLCGSQVPLVRKKDISSDGFKQKRACVTEQTGGDMARANLGLSGRRDRGVCDPGSALSAHLSRQVQGPCPGGHQQLQAQIPQGAHPAEGALPEQ